MNLGFGDPSMSHLVPLLEFNLIEYEALWEDAKDGPDELARDVKAAFQKLRKRQADLEPRL